MNEKMRLWIVGICYTIPLLLTPWLVLLEKAQAGESPITRLTVAIALLGGCINAAQGLRMWVDGSMERFRQEQAEK